MLLKQRPVTGRAAVASPQLVAQVNVPLRPSSPHRRQARRPHVCFSAQNEEQQQASQGAQQQQPSQPQTTIPTSSLPDAKQPNGMYSVMAGLAAAGALETSYLTATKLLNATAACPTNGCDSVLNSAFGSLFGLPLPLYGAATYSAVALAAGLAAARVAGQRPVPGWLSTGLATGVAVLATTSAALMAILHTQLGGAPCVWCYASAGLSGALLVALVAGMDRRRMADAAGPGLGGTAAAAAALYLGFGSILTGNAAELELTYANPVVTTQSSEQALSLAHRCARHSGSRSGPPARVCGFFGGRVGGGMGGWEGLWSVQRHHREATPQHCWVQAAHL